MRKSGFAGVVIGIAVALAAVAVVGVVFLVGLLAPYRAEDAALPVADVTVPPPDPPEAAPRPEAPDPAPGAPEPGAESPEPGPGAPEPESAPPEPGSEPSGVQPEATGPAAAPATTAAREDAAPAAPQVQMEADYPAPAAHPLADYQPMAVEPVEPRLPEPTADLPDQWRELNEVVFDVAADFPGRLSVVAVDLTSGSRYEFRAKDPYLPASTFKLPVTLCVLEEIAAGSLAWDTPVTYTEEDAEPVGAGNFDTAPFGSRWSVRNLVDRSLISSNNVAVKMLARTLTWEGLLDCTTRIGGPVTRTAEGSTPVSAADEAAWWLHLWKTWHERPALAEELLRPLRQVTYHGRIQAGTPRPELVTHKFGSYAGYEHDGAVVWAERPYILVVLTHGNNEYLADLAIERIAAAAWKAVVEQGE